MKLIRSIRLLAAAAMVVSAGLTSASCQSVYTPPTNPPARIQLSWDPPADNTPPATNYAIYYGCSPRTYTNRVCVGTSLTLTITNLTRGATYYFAVTAGAEGMEGGWSDEVFCRPSAPPGSPSMHAPTVLAATQSKTSTANSLLARITTNYCSPPSGMLAITLIPDTTN